MEKEKLSTAILYAEYVPTVCFSKNRPQIICMGHIVSIISC